ncbi:MAG: hypothetical protein HFG92_10935 [Dorea sp.]|nr:hypothetical protein [Dorea sp.]
MLKDEVHNLKNDVQILKDEVHNLKNDVQILKDEIHALKNDVQILKDEVQVLKNDVQILKDEVQVLKNEVVIMNDKVLILKQDTQRLDHRMTHIELTLENETNHGIKIIAEGHLDLNRKLSEVLKFENEKEMILLRVTHLENEMRSVKEQLNQSA